MINRNKNGALATEFVMAFMFLSLCLLIVVWFTFWAVSKEVENYYSYMKVRAVKVEMGVEEPMRKECEDNPLWYIRGEGACS